VVVARPAVRLQAQQVPGGVQHEGQEVPPARAPALRIARDDDATVGQDREPVVDIVGAGLADRAPPDLVARVVDLEHQDLGVAPRARAARDDQAAARGGLDVERAVRAWLGEHAPPGLDAGFVHVDQEQVAPIQALGVSHTQVARGCGSQARDPVVARGPVAVLLQQRSARGRRREVRVDAARPDPGRKASEREAAVILLADGPEGVDPAARAVLLRPVDRPVVAQLDRERPPVAGTRPVDSVQEADRQAAPVYERHDVVDPVVGGTRERPEPRDLCGAGRDREGGLRLGHLRRSGDRGHPQDARSGSAETARHVSSLRLSPDWTLLDTLRGSCRLSAGSTP
jgi:hypothetical protein